MQGVLAGRYRLERQLGKGGMGSVWLAEHLALRSWVAVKLMDPAIAATPEGAERFRREAQAAASLRSAHVVQVLDYGVDEATPYLVMELMQGESLASCVEREQRLTPQRVVAIMTQVARALGRAHAADIVHRDLKPDNIFLVREDDQELVKILDFGIAKTPQSQFGGMETRTGVTMGTPYYMSPEQVEGKKALDFRTDLWAMAVIASECMTGVRPFDGSTFGELLLNICARPIPMPSSQGVHLPGFDDWFAKATNREPSLRFASAQDLANSLKDVVARAPGGPALAAPAPATAYMPAPTPPGQAAYAPAATAGPGPMPTTAGPGPYPAAQYAPAPYAPAPTAGHGPLTGTGNAPSVSSINTSQAFNTGARSPSALPWILLAGVTLVGAVGATVLLMRPKTSDSAAEPRIAGAPPSNPAPQPSIDIAPAPSAGPPAVGNDTAKHASNKRPNGGDAHQDATPASTPAPPATLPPPAIVPDPPGPPATATRKPAATTGGSTMCFSDPFSGQLRPTSVSHPPGTASFACKQDPFTGKYKKL